MPADYRLVILGTALGTSAELQERGTDGAWTPVAGARPKVAAGEILEAAIPFADLGLRPTDDISPGHDFVISSFTPEAWQRGSYPFVCTRSDCGGDPEQHAGMIGQLLIE